LLYLLVDAQLIFFPLFLWTLANDIFDMAQSKRLFPLIGVGTFIGQIVGLTIAAGAAGLLQRVGLSSIELLSLNAVVYLMAFAVAWIGLRGTKQTSRRQATEKLRDTLSEGWGFVREVPSFRYLMLAMTAVSLVSTILLFNFLKVTDHAYTATGQFQTFYSLYRLGLTVVAIAVQGLVASRLIGRIGIKNVFLVLPSTLLAGSLVALFFPGVASSVAAMGLARLVQTTVDESARKSFQSLVPEERRGRVSIFMDSYLFAIGSILSCVIIALILWVTGQWNPAIAPYIYLGVAAVTAAFTLGAILKMHAVYESSLLNWRLKRRQRSSNVWDKLIF
jgi:MFS family permease